MTARTYKSVHESLRRTRGSAVGRPCAHPDCDRPADGWGLGGHPTHIGYNGGQGKVVRWSTDLDAYEPMCARHNAQLDHGGNWSLCPRGHARIAWGTNTRGHCRGCLREWNREAHARRKTSRQTAGTIAQQGTNTNIERRPS